MMKLKRILCLLMTFCLILGLYGCSFPTISVHHAPRETQPDPATEPVTGTEDPVGAASVTPLLYRATSADGNVLWLFGSIHVGYDYFYPLPDYVYDAYESADAIAFEIDMRAFEKDTAAQAELLKLALYQDGTTIKDHVDPEIYEAAVDILAEYGYASSYLDLMKPTEWSSLLDMCFMEEMGLDYDLGIDYHLMDRAYADGKQILEVESAEFQYTMMANFSPELQEMLLANSIASFYNMELSKQDMQYMVELWTSGDEEAFAAYLEEEPIFTSEEERKLYDEYNKALIVDRNLSMTDYAEAALKSDREIFICVGSAHIVGKGAIVDLLRQRGYTVERVFGTIAI